MIVLLSFMKEFMAKYDKIILSISKLKIRLHYGIQYKIFKTLAEVGSFTKTAKIFYQFLLHTKYHH
ncbi:hypothetical protein A9Q84_18075 [Halobacteriovorax marinus]|uniref:Uncharacterized protein n=1 Tax=Halobacteriovorax marinus TaxID=97084 RepID=A0A1Y5F9V8_9BACT|nr:hypothetical protein A9Q84_18075 [Halobacteriovorax marinus]